MLDMSLIIMVVVLALVFDFINGFHDTANAIATCVPTMPSALASPSSVRLSSTSSAP